MDDATSGPEGAKEIVAAVGKRSLKIDTIGT
jgi:hypothetical protein